MTRVPVPEFPFRIDHHKKSFFIGSCFTDYIGGKMNLYKFPVNINPFGAIYNPLSIVNSLNILIGGKVFTKEDLYFYNNNWLSFSHNTLFSDGDPDKCLEKINSSIEEAHDFLKNAGLVFISLGTSWVYEFKKTGNIVSNCHKIPSSEFNRFMLKVDDIVQSLNNVFQALQAFSPNCQIVLTVSPVRHWKDGAHGNQVSKSALFVAVEELIEKNKQVSYFPSYEIVMDELRDYRFYARDMIHIGELAVDYIWQKFKDALITDESKKIIEDIVPLARAYNHKPFDKNSEGYEQFILHLQRLVEKLSNKYPFINFNAEKDLMDS